MNNKNNNKKRTRASMHNNKVVTQKSKQLPPHHHPSLPSPPPSPPPPPHRQHHHHRRHHQEEEQQEQRPFFPQSTSWDNHHHHHHLHLLHDALSVPPRRSTDPRHIWKDAAHRRTNNRSIRVTDTFYDRDALRLSLAQHGQHLIETMAFSMRPRSLRPDQATAPGPVLSQAAIDLLSGRLTGPNLRRIEIECNLETETRQFEHDVHAVFRQPKDEETLLQLEGDDATRRLLADTWTALAANPAVRELAVDRFAPVWASSFHSARFRAFLGRLDRLDISLFGSKNGHRCINTVPAYIDSLQSLLKVLFLHCAAVTSLALHASQHAPLGARGHFHIPLSLKATQLPQLRHLSLKNCFIGPELAHFLNAHMHTLESLALLNCYSYRGAADDVAGIAWAPFLDMVTRPGMKLRRLVIDDDYIPLTFADARLDAYDPDKAHEPRDVKEVRRAQQKNPALRLFLYGFLRDYSGEPWMNKDAIISSFHEREDQGAYERLMALVDQNALGGGAGSPNAGAASEKASMQVGTVEVVELPV